MNETFQQIVEKAKQKKKDEKLTVSVTQVIRLNKCPMQGVLYSSLSPFKTKPNKRMTIGSLAHSFFEIYYESDPNSSVQDLLDLAIKNFKQGIYTTNDKWEYFKQHQDEIEAEALKYFKTFLNWVKWQPKPFQTEQFLQYGMLTGNIDALNKYNTTLWVNDYKTSSSRPTEEYLIDYLDQLGGYCYLVMKRFPEYHLTYPQLTIFKKASTQIIILDGTPDQNYPEVLTDFRIYIEDFKGLLKESAKIILNIVKDIIPEAIESSQCHWCLSRDICEQMRRK